MKAVSPQQRGWSGPWGMACHEGEHRAQSRLHRDVSVSCWPLHSCRSLSRVTSRRTSVPEQEPVVPSRPVARAGRAGRRRGRPWVRPWIPRAEGLLGWVRPAPSWTPLPGPGKALPVRPLGRWDWATRRAGNACRRHRFHSAHHPRSSPSPGREMCPPGDTQTPQRDLCWSWR